MYYLKTYVKPSCYGVFFVLGIFGMRPAPSMYSSGSTHEQIVRFEIVPNLDQDLLFVKMSMFGRKGESKFNSAILEYQESTQPSNNHSDPAEVFVMDTCPIMSKTLSRMMYNPKTLLHMLSYDTNNKLTI